MTRRMHAEKNTSSRHLGDVMKTLTDESEKSTHTSLSVSSRHLSDDDSIELRCRNSETRSLYVCLSVASTHRYSVINHLVSN